MSTQLIFCWTVRAGKRGGGGAWQERRRRRGGEEEEQLQKDRLAAAIKDLTKRKSMLESEKETMQQKPAIDLMAETKLFRQDVFKSRYRAKSSVMDID
jgi:hypothetical protein